MPFHFVLQVIIDFLDILNSTEQESVKNNTKLFASQMTTESLQVTLMCPQHYPLATYMTRASDIC